MRRKFEVPLFCEELRVAPLVRWVLGLGTAGAAAVGMWAATRPEAVFAWLSGLALTGATVGLFACWRLARFETTVGRYGVRAGLWEFAWSFPRTAVEQASAYPARSWRRFFAAREVQVTLTVSGKRRVLALPSRQAEELVAILQENP